MHIGNLPGKFPPRRNKTTIKHGDLHLKAILAKEAKRHVLRWA